MAKGCSTVEVCSDALILTSNTMKKISFLLLTTLLLAATSCQREDNTPVKIAPISGAVLEPNIGGPSETNQVWIELATGQVTETHRELWDLGFYCGQDFRVILNSSLIMAAGKIENTTNIDLVNSTSVAAMQNVVMVSNFQDNSQYVDNPSGQYLSQTTGIDAIKLDDNENNVYLINMGYGVHTGNTVPGTVYSMGDTRGWKKIRVIRQNNDYKIQYANLNDTTHKEFVIAKDEAYNFKFFSLVNENLVNIQPKKKNWDLCFSVFTNLTDAGTFMTSYVYPDFVINNTLGHVYAYQITTAAGQGETAFNNFKVQDIDHSKFVTNDQRTIGSNWRTTTGANGVEVYNNRFYIVKNSDGYYFKLRFLRMKNDQGYRGYPQFEYKAL